MAEERLVRVKFKATPQLQTWQHRKGAIIRSSFGRGETMRLYPRQVLKDGDIAKMTLWESRWAMHHYPENFIQIGSIEKVDLDDPLFDLDACTYHQLQVLASSFGIPPKGLAKDLRASIRIAMDIRSMSIPAGD